MKRKKALINKEKIAKVFKPTKKKIIVLVLLIAAAGVWYFTKGKKSDMTMTAKAADIVTRGDINSEITGSAAVEPYERYEIIPKANGDIIYCPYNVGDHVNKGDKLYGFDTSDTDLTIERQRISLQQSANSYKDALDEREKLVITAKNTGVVSDLTIKAGQDIKAGEKIASINDTKLLEVQLPFTQAQIDSIQTGDAAVITSSKHMSSVNGTVTHKDSVSYAGADGSALFNVTVSFENPGAFYDGLTVGGSVGANVSPGSGTVKNSDSGSVSSEAEGTVSRVYFANGDYVKKGDIIAELTSDSITDKINDSTLSYKSASISMQQTEKTLDDYNITSPISGTVITKNAKAGDTIDRTNSVSTLMVIADVSRLKFSLEIDELDVSKVSEGQTVSVTCDALPDEEFAGVITKLSVEGSAQNGVTTYSAEVVIDNPGNLRPSMNVDASIIIESAEDVLMVPTADVTSFGGKSYVFVKDENYDKDSAAKSGKNTEKTGKGIEKEHKGNQLGAHDSKGGMSGGAPSGMPGGEEPGGAVSSAPEGAPEGVPGGAPNGERLPSAPEEGYRAVEVVTGISNEDYTEIISGLTEGQEIYSRSTVSTESSFPMMMGGMSGGMGGSMSAAPSGGSGGGMGGRSGGGMGGGPGGR